ncbi:MAG: tRNA pseudouridine(38-40) synthase TruA [Woeseiaceae bacterium]|nr:tRNA pseudouridine(38-40) synthase TruA [Woeseiaceae bacterium]
MRIAAGVEYDGTAYNGWQRVASGTGVQEVVERALSRVADHEVSATCAGRTDAGVHATAQVIHFDSGSERSERSWLLGGNSNLPDDVVLHWIRRVSDDFHARYSASARTYRYLILNRLVRPALLRHRAWWLHDPLDTGRMSEAAQALLGEHDFSAFRAAGCQSRTAVRRITELRVERVDDWVSITITANAFLQHMVRNITGLLAEIGRGDAEPSAARDILEGRDRTAAGVAAPARGLTLVAVEYPAAFGLPASSVPQLVPGVR